jgi:hypothetical protein
MTTMSEVHVTLSAALWSKFQQLVDETGIPLEWLAAALVCDTLEGARENVQSPAIPCCLYQSQIDATTPINTSSFYQ